MSRRGRLLLLLGAVAALLVGLHLSAGASETAAESARQKAAEHYVEGVIDHLILPPGSVASRLEPHGGGASLAGPPGGAARGGPETVTRHRFWTVPESPDATLRWIAAHAPQGARLEGRGSAGVRGQGTAYWSIRFTLPAGKRALTGGELFAQLVRARTAGSVLLRVDASVEWLRPRPAGSFIPTAVLSVAVLVGKPQRFESFSRRPKQTVLPGFRIADHREVRALVGAINSLALEPVRSGSAVCPAQHGEIYVWLILRGAAGARGPAATVQADPYPCGSQGAAYLSVGDRSPVTLNGGTRLIRLAEADVKHKLP